MGQSTKPLQNGFSRVFIIPGRARGDHRPEYFSQLKMGALSQSFGEITKIEIPDPNEYGKYLEVDRIRGAVERGTFSLTGRFAAAIKSRLLSLARGGCPVDVQLHIGECTSPSAFNVFTKAVIAEDSVITNHSTEDLGSLESGEGAVVNETAEISSTDYYEVVPLSFVQRAGTIVTNHVNDVTIFDSASCGNCLAESDGCNRIFAVTDQAGGSSGTSPDIVYSLNGGATWFAHDVDTLTTVQDAVSVFGVGDYVVVLSTAAGSESYALVQDFIDGIDPVFIELTTGFVGAPRHGFSLGRQSFIVGNSGYVYYCDDPTSGVTVLDAGSATADQLNYVHAMDTENGIAVGNNGAVIFTSNGTSWGAAPKFPVGVTINLTSCFMKSETEWWVTASNGKMYYTLNAGKSWTEKTLPGTTPTTMQHIVFSTNSVGYASGIVSAHGRIYRTFDGGYSWVITPEAVGSIPVSDEFTRLAVCKQDPNFVVGVGINDNATDGIIVTGEG